RILDQSIAVDAHAWRQNAAIDLSPRHDRSLADYRVERGATAVWVGVDELRRWIGRPVGVDWPVPVVEVEDGIDLDQIETRLKIGVEGADIAPVGRLLAVLIAERIGEDTRVAQHPRNDVLAKVVAARLLPRSILKEQLVHRVGGEHVDAHR